MARNRKIAETFSASDIGAAPMPAAPAPPVGGVKPADESRAAETGPETGAEPSAPISAPAVIGADLATGPDRTIVAPIVALVISARQPVRRRAGRLFTPEPVRIPVGDLSDDDLAALAGDPMLDVRTETVEAAETLVHVQV